MGRGVEYRFVASDTALANGIKEMCGTGCSGGDFVQDFESVGVGGEKLVAGVLVGFALASGGHGGRCACRRLLAAKRAAGQQCSENGGRECERFAHGPPCRPSYRA